MAERTALAVALHTRRWRLGLTLRDVARQSGVGLSTLCRIEAGELPSMSSFLLLWDWLNMPADELLRAMFDDMTDRR